MFSDNLSDLIKTVLQTYFLTQSRVITAGPQASSLGYIVEQCAGYRLIDGNLHTRID